MVNETNIMILLIITKQLIMLKQLTLRMTPDSESEFLKGVTPDFRPIFECPIFEDR